MGSANLLFAKKKTDEAMKMAFEVIRNCPGRDFKYFGIIIKYLRISLSLKSHEGCPEPYQLIREVLLERDFELLAHRLSLFIATIDHSTDSDTWLTLATDRNG